jgi:SAM-dependent methyltransferase
MTASLTPSQSTQPSPVACYDCLVCNYHIDPGNSDQFVAFPCNIRAFRTEYFQVWRCPNCQTIHTVEQVDLDHYYAKYPFGQAELTWFNRIIFSTSYRQFQQHGLQPHHKFLDYGCGVNGTFVKFLQEKGYQNCYGYDPYGPAGGTGNPDSLQQAPFDYILLQDIIEHVADPRALLQQLDQLLAPGGYLLLGTPNADHIDLSTPELSNSYNAVHVPYHLHLFNRQTVEALAQAQGWQVTQYYDRGYDDTPWFGLNTRAWNVYQRLQDGSLDVLFEPIPMAKLARSPEFLFNALFGYFLSYKTDMAIMFYKPLK